MSLILSGTDGLSDVDGSAATPAIRGTDANTGIFFPAADTIAFAEGGAEVARFDSSGNFGIGTISPTANRRLDAVLNANASTGIRVANNDAGSATSTNTTYSNGTTTAEFGMLGTGYGSYGVLTAGNGYIYVGSNKALQLSSDGGFIAFGTGTTGAERARIDSSGNFGVGTTSPSTYGKLAVNSTAIGGATVAITKENSGSANQNGPILYMNNSGPAATGRNANVVAGQILWQFSQPSSGALQYAGEIAVLSDSQGGASTASSLNLYSSGGLGLTVNSSANTVIAGALSKASGSFRIDHPLLELEETHQLVHSFIEGPQADLIYRGKVNLVNGTATVNIDTASTMTEGTFVALCRDVQCFTTNESDWTAVRGSVTDNILTIEAEDNTSTASISWMVIGERKDKHMMVTDWTDDNGKVIVEPLKEQSSTALESA
jgi:hypothetical protein